MGNKHSKSNNNNNNNDEINANELRKQQRKLFQEKENLLASLDIQEQEINISCDYSSLNDNYLRFVILSDTHNKIQLMDNEIPNGDILIHAGDFTDFSTDEEIQEFLLLFLSLPHKYKIIVGGNHDKTILNTYSNINEEEEEEYSDIIKDFKEKEKNKEFIYLHNNIIEIESIKIYGISWCGNDVNILQDIYNNIELQFDILITHAPPLGIGDIMIPPKHSGDTELLKFVLNKEPKYHIFGHAHEGYGIYTCTNKTQTIFINGAICSRNLKPQRKPIVFDYKIKE